MSAPIVSLCLLVALCLHTGLAQDGYEVFPSVPGSRYKLYFPDLADWATALDRCQSDGDGAKLVVINSEEEASVVRSLISQILADGFYDAWVGINDIDTEGTWVTVNGGLVSESGYDKWVSGSPTDDTFFNCGLAYYDGLYEEWACASSRPFICEKPNV